MRAGFLRTIFKWEVSQMGDIDDLIFGDAETRPSDR